MTVTERDIRNAVITLGLGNLPVCVHSSLRSFGWVEGGGRTVVDGLLHEGCTLIVPCFTGAFETAPPPDRRYARNGCDYDTEFAAMYPTGVYSRDTTAIDGDLGAIPAVVVSDPRRERGVHPLNSFAALGPLAAELVACQRPMDVYAPLRALAERAGWVVLMGVDLTSMTLIHLAEAMAGRTLLRRWANGSDGSVVECEIGSCSNGFERIQPTLEPVMRCIDVGTSRWRAYPAARALELAADEIRRDPTITQCADPACLICRDIIQGGPIVEEHS